MLECCVRFVAYRVKSNFYAIVVSGCVCVSHCFREEDYKNYLAVISYVSSVCKELLSSECLAVRTHGYRTFTVKLSKHAPFSYIN